MMKMKGKITDKWDNKNEKKPCNIKIEGFDQWIGFWKDKDIVVEEFQVGDGILFGMEEKHKPDGKTFFNGYNPEHLTTTELMNNKKGETSDSKINESNEIKKQLSEILSEAQNLVDRL